MSRFLADLRHVRQHMRCAGQTGKGTQCTRMTNYQCVFCAAGLCGAHQTNHRCANSGAVK